MKKMSAQVAPTILPRYCRIPKPGSLDPLTGLTRTQIFLLLKSGKVKSKVLKNKANATRGIRLIDVPSLLSAIEQA